MHRVGWFTCVLLVFASCRDFAGGSIYTAVAGQGGTQPEGGSASAGEHGGELATGGAARERGAGGTSGGGRGGTHPGLVGGSGGQSTPAGARGGAVGDSRGGAAGDAVNAFAGDMNGGGAGEAGVGAAAGSIGAGGSSGEGGTNVSGASSMGGATTSDDCAVHVPGMACFRAATFTMGRPDVFDGEPRHEAAVGSFYMDLTEVTVGAYSDCVRQSFCDPSVTTPDGLGGACAAAQVGADDDPLNCVSGRQALAYCTSVGKRLPTEAEWEYAAFGGVRTYAWGEDPPNSSRVNANDSWFAEDGWGQDAYAWLAPAESFAAGATPEGLLHMLGNVWEWTLTRSCTDGRTCEHCQRPDLCAQDCSNCKLVSWVVRGGSYRDPGNAETVLEMAGHRGIRGAGEFADYMGFRCAMDAPSR